MRDERDKRERETERERKGEKRGSATWWPARWWLKMVIAAGSLHKERERER